MTFILSSSLGYSVISSQWCLLLIFKSYSHSAQWSPARRNEIWMNSQREYMRREKEKKKKKKKHKENQQIKPK